MTILITGGSGFLGINLVRYLLGVRNYKIIVMDIAPFDYPEKSEIIFIKGDIRDPAVVADTIKQADVIIHTAAALPLYSKEDIISTDIDGTKTLLKAAEKAKIKRFIHISSTAVYGVPDHPPLIESDPVNGVGPYGIAKVKAEELCLNYRSKGICIPIIRPKSFVGPERLGVFAMLFNWAKEGHNFPLIGNGKNRYQLLDVEDLCQAIYLCMTKDKNLVNDTFNIGAGSYGTMEEDYQAVLDIAGHGKKIIKYPASIVIPSLRILEFFKLSPLYKWVYETAHKDAFVSIEKSQEKLGYIPKFSNQEALIRNYNWYIKNESNFVKNSGVSHRTPWKQGILGLIKLIF